MEVFHPDNGVWFKLQMTRAIAAFDPTQVKMIVLTGGILR